MELGKLLVIIGLMFALAGLVLLWKGQIPWLGKLPGDFHFKQGNFQVYFPLATCILLSLILTAVLYLFRK
jgi:ribose/xylose/arabinose/galactoside ABC-type transport system permease subunit